MADLPGPRTDEERAEFEATLQGMLDKLGAIGFIGILFMPGGPMALIGRANGRATECQHHVLTGAQDALKELLDSTGEADPTTSYERRAPEHGKPIKLN